MNDYVAMAAVNFCVSICSIGGNSVAFNGYRIMDIRARGVRFGIVVGL